MKFIYIFIALFFLLYFKVNLASEININDASKTEYSSVGKDTAASFADGKFEIGNYSGTYNLVMVRSKESRVKDSLLEGCYRYEWVKNKFYILSEEGVAVFDNDNPKLKIYLTIPDEKYKNGPLSRFVEDEMVEYLHSFSDYTEDEQKILNEFIEEKEKE